MEYKNIKFTINLPYIVKLKYDKPIEKPDAGYGIYWIYGVIYDDEDYTFIADVELHSLLSKHKKNDIVEIIKVDDGDKKSHFEVESLSEKDVNPPSKVENNNQPNWDKINADKQHSIVLQVAFKKAVDSLPVKAKLTDNDYKEIEIRTVKFNAIMEKYLGGVTMKQPEEKKTAKKPAKTKSKSESAPKPKNGYLKYHEDLITECCGIIKTKNRLPVIQTLSNMAKAWKIKNIEKLTDTDENQCLNLLEEFDTLQKKEADDNLPY